MKILSVDWDYHFPDTMPYDWGMNETQGIFYEFVWTIRASGFNMLNKKRAMDEMVVNPEYKTFWDRQVEDLPEKLYVAESHAILYNLLKLLRIKNAEVVNFDAHHDCGYGKNDNGNNCGNWVLTAKKKKYIKNYTVIYPEWRKPKDEHRPDVKPDRILKVIEKQKYDMIFVCRSSCWTPAWEDCNWLKFVEPLFKRGAYEFPQPMKKENWLRTCRKVDLEAAKAHEKVITELMKQHSQGKTK